MCCPFRTAPPPGANRICGRWACPTTVLGTGRAPSSVGTCLALCPTYKIMFSEGFIRARPGGAVENVEKVKQDDRSGQRPSKPAIRYHLSTVASNKRTPILYLVFTPRQRIFTLNRALFSFPPSLCLPPYFQFSADHPDRKSAPILQVKTQTLSDFLTTKLLYG